MWDMEMEKLKYRQAELVPPQHELQLPPLMDESLNIYRPVDVSHNWSFDAPTGNAQSEYMKESALDGDYESFCRDVYRGTSTKSENMDKEVNLSKIFRFNLFANHLIMLIPRLNLRYSLKSYSWYRTMHCSPGLCCEQIACYA